MIIQLYEKISNCYVKLLYYMTERDTREAKQNKNKDKHDETFPTLARLYRRQNHVNDISEVIFYE